MKQLPKKIFLFKTKINTGGHLIIPFGKVSDKQFNYFLICRILPLNDRSMNLQHLHSDFHPNTNPVSIYIISNTDRNILGNRSSSNVDDLQDNQGNFIFPSCNTCKKKLHNE